MVTKADKDLDTALGLVQYRSATRTVAEVKLCKPLLPARQNAAEIRLIVQIFMFNLPLPMLSASPSRPLWYLLDWCHRQGHHRGQTEAITEQLLAESQAASFGPSSAECTKPGELGKTYGPSVLARAGTNPPGDWLQRIRVYREGLASARWALAKDLQRYRPPTEASTSAFKCAVTAMYGLQDAALDPKDQSGRH